MKKPTHEMKLEAVRKSLAGWIENKKAGGIVNECPCCDFANNYPGPACSPCYVQEITGAEQCQNTPYYEAREAAFNPNEDFEHHAQRMIECLEEVYEKAKRLGEENE